MLLIQLSFLGHSPPVLCWSLLAHIKQNTIITLITLNEVETAVIITVYGWFGCYQSSQGISVFLKHN